MFRCGEYGERKKMFNSKGHNNNGLRHSTAFSVVNGELVVTAKMHDIDMDKRRVSINGQQVNISASANLSSGVIAF